MFKKFIGNGFCVSRKDSGDEVIIEVKMGVVLLPDNNVAGGRKEKEGKQPTKETRKKGKVRKKSTKKVVAKSWKRFKSDELRKLGKKLAEHKCGYEFGVKYDFREFYFEKDWDEIVNRAVNVEERENLVPFDGHNNFSDDGSETEGYTG